MTRDEIKTRLLQYRTVKRKINALTNEIARLSSRTETKSPMTARRIVLLEKKLSKEILSTTDLCSAIERAIAELDDPRLYELMYLHYVEGDTWEDVAAKTHYSQRYIYRLQETALDQIVSGDLQRSVFNRGRAR